LYFGVVVSFLAISTPAVLTVPLFHVLHFQSPRRAQFTNTTTGPWLTQTYPAGDYCREFLFRLVRPRQEHCSR